jgi:phage shock protein PspC (stress-responsive transcriptional regulator)
MYRSENGMLLGVSQALSEIFGIDVLFIRLAWVISVVFFGMGLMIYLVLAISFPIKQGDKIDQSDKFLGVCSQISKKNNLDLGALRLVCCCLAIVSFGMTAFFYIVLYFLLPKSSDSNFPL